MRIPDVDLSKCILCEICVEVCPDVFRLNDAGYIEVVDHFLYPYYDVNEAIKNCPTDCIFWVED
jgi:ferredoxin